MLMMQVHFMTRFWHVLVTPPCLLVALMAASYVLEFAASRQPFAKLCVQPGGLAAAVPLTICRMQWLCCYTHCYSSSQV